MGTQSRMKTVPLTLERRKEYELMVTHGNRQARRAAAARLKRDDSMWRGRARTGLGFTKKIIDPTT